MPIHPVPDVSDRENFRLVELDPIGSREVLGVRRDSIEPVPVGTTILMAFQVTGYDQDCDGSLMARLASVDANGETTGWHVDCIGLHPDTAWVIDNLAELDREGL